MGNRQANSRNNTSANPPANSVSPPETAAASNSVEFENPPTPSPPPASQTDISEPISAPPEILVNTDTTNDSSPVESDSQDMFGGDDIESDDDSTRESTPITLNTLDERSNPPPLVISPPEDAIVISSLQSDITVIQFENDTNTYCLTRSELGQISLLDGEFPWVTQDALAEMHALVHTSIAVPGFPVDLAEIIVQFLWDDLALIVIPTTIKPDIWMRVHTYLVHHADNPPKEIEKPLRSANMREVVSEWDAAFVEVDQETLFEMILTANELQIPTMIDLTCAKVASMIKGKTPEEIRKQFNIANDFTPEEEAAVRAENKWAEDS